ncbi:MAG: plasmid pRiA4b ORF-3 family protein [Acidobacteriota bacterium]|nr:plasmid pRiA4b ORF-3 family protein [Acidobacteriota bacterium]
MNQTTLSIEIYPFRIVLCETGPHIWRRILVANGELHEMFREWFPGMNSEQLPMQSAA